VQWSKITVLRSLQDKLEARFGRDRGNSKLCFCIICLTVFIFVLLLGTMGAWNYVLYNDSQFNWEVINNLIASKDGLVTKVSTVQNDNGAISKKVIEFDNGK